MNAIEANDRLRLLEHAMQGIERAIEKENERGDTMCRHALRIVCGELKNEADILQNKLEKTQI